MAGALIFGYGQLGYAVERRLRDAGQGVTVVARASCDVTDARAVAATIAERHPSAVYSCAAFTAVEAAEARPEEAYAVNALGAYYLARASAAAGAAFVHASTDYVFDGSKPEGFTEDDRPHPLNVYGASKLAGEQLVAIAHPAPLTVRTSALFGRHAESGKVNFVDRVVSAGRAGERLRIVNDQFTRPTYAADLAAALVELVGRGAHGLLHWTNAGSCSWFEFAAAILETAGLNTPLQAIGTVQSPTTINRPRYSLLRTDALAEPGLAAAPSWRNALTRYIKETYGNRSSAS